MHSESDGETDCIFCKIVAGEIPSFRLYEDDRVLSFMDINPFHDGHCLVITKSHADTIFTADADDLAAAIRAAKRVATAVNAALQPAGMNIVQANGPAAGQTVFHYHMHIFPRRDGDKASFNWEHKPGDMDRIQAIHAKISAALENGQ